MLETVFKDHCTENLTFTESTVDFSFQGKEMRAQEASFNYPTRDSASIAN